jgi:hypothetical protein
MGSMQNHTRWKKDKPGNVMDKIHFRGIVTYIKQYKFFRDILKDFWKMCEIVCKRCKISRNF